MELTTAELSAGPVSADLARRIRQVVAADRATPCRVVDMRLSPGEPSHVLFEVGDHYVVGSSEGDRSSLLLAPIEADEALPGLALVHDPVAVQDLAARWLPGWRVVRCRAELLRYRPGRRATFALHTSSIGPDGQLDRRRLIAKVYHDEAKAQAVHAVMSELASIDVDSHLRLAPPLGIEATAGIVGQAAAAGTCLGPLLATAGPRSTTGIEQAAHALAALHRLPIVTTRTRSLATVITKLDRRSRRLAVRHPAAADPLVALVQRLSETHDAQRRSGAGRYRPALVHGDAKADQFLLDGGGVTLLDLDHCGAGDPAGDVADFVAKLHQRSLASGRPAPETAVVLARHFRRAYGSAAAVDDGFEARVVLHTAAGLARRALRSLQRAPVSPLSRRLVAESHRHLDTLAHNGGTDP